MCFVKKFGRTTPKPGTKCGWEKCGRMGHSEDDCYLRKIQAEREEKNAEQEDMKQPSPDQ